jgi:processive 1,2-diacylglycerol beta-glucosyltransferase
MGRHRAGGQKKIVVPFPIRLNLLPFDVHNPSRNTRFAMRLLLLSVSAGAGHGRAAEALRAEAQASFPDVDAKHIDVMTLVPKSFHKLYAEYYIKIVERHPSVWAYLYHATDKMPRDALFAKVRRAIERLNTVGFVMP